MELEVYKKSDFYEDYISSQKEYYERENANAYFAERLAEKDKLIASLQDTNKVLAHNCVRLNKMLAEKDKEIALLKERICNGDVSRLTWIDDCIDKDKEIAELKQKLEDAKATAYAESVDAGMENHRLKDKLRHYPMMVALLESNKKEIAELKDIDSKNRSAYYKDLSMMAKDVEHQKFKRCLAMARQCHNESLWWYSKGYGFEKYDKFWEKWEKRWLELAGKFKEAK